MRQIAILVALLAAGLWLLARIEFSESAALSEMQPQWRRTTNGWERREWWAAAASPRPLPPSVPLGAAGLQLAVALFASLASEAGKGTSTKR